MDRLGWVNPQQLLDAVSIGQAPPGRCSPPRRSWATSSPGCPARSSQPWRSSYPPRVRRPAHPPHTDKRRSSAWISALLDGVNATALALMAGVTYQLARTAIVDPLTVAIAMVSLVLLRRTRLNSAWLTSGGATLGLARALLPDWTKRIPPGFDGRRVRRNGSPHRHAARPGRRSGRFSLTPGNTPTCCTTGEIQDRCMVPQSAHAAPRSLSRGDHSPLAWGWTGGLMDGMGGQSVEGHRSALAAAAAVLPLLGLCRPRSLAGERHQRHGCSGAGPYPGRRGGHR